MNNKGYECLLCDNSDLCKQLLARTKDRFRCPIGNIETALPDKMVVAPVATKPAVRDKKSVHAYNSYAKKLEMCPSGWFRSRELPTCIARGTWVTFLTAAVKRRDLEVNDVPFCSPNRKYRKTGSGSKPNKDRTGTYMSYEARLKMLPQGWFHLKELSGKYASWYGFLQLALSRGHIERRGKGPATRYHRVEVTKKRDSGIAEIRVHDPFEAQKEERAKRLEDARKAGIV